MLGPTVMLATPRNNEGVRHAVALGDDHTVCGLALDGLPINTWQRWPNGADAPKGEKCGLCGDAAS